MNSRQDCPILETTLKASSSFANVERLLNADHFKKAGVFTEHRSRVPCAACLQDAQSFALHRPSWGPDKTSEYL